MPTRGGVSWIIFATCLLVTPSFGLSTSQGGPAILSGGTPSWTVEGNLNGKGLGDSVAIVGYVNGDGFDDVQVGAGNYDQTGSSSDRRRPG